MQQKSYLVTRTYDLKFDSFTIKFYCSDFLEKEDKEQINNLL